MTIQLAYTDGGTAGFVDVPSIDLYAEAPPSVKILADVSEWARTATIVAGPADERSQAHDREIAFRITSMACDAGLSVDEIRGIQAHSGLSWPAIELLLATIAVNNWHSIRGA